MFSYFYFMKLSKEHQDFKTKYGFTIHPNLKRFEKWTETNTFSLQTLFPTIFRDEIHHIDLSTTSSFIGGEEEFNNLDFFENKLDELQKKVPNKIIVGGYLEKRALYTSDIYKKENSTEKRNIHLGVDFWLPAQTPVHTLLKGKIVCITDDNYNKGYGGLLILKHEIDNISFYTLYGHLSLKSIMKHKVGDILNEKSKIGVLGNALENGDWVPHLHFQILITLLDYKNDFPGVAYESEIDYWKSICPNPNLLFKLKELDI